MKDTLSRERGQSIPLQITFWQDAEKTTALDLTGATVTIRESTFDASIAVVSIADALNGICSVLIDEAGADTLSSGRTNWFRLEAQFAADNVVTPKIWILING